MKTYIIPIIDLYKKGTIGIQTAKVLDEIKLIQAYRKELKAKKFDMKGVFRVEERTRELRYIITQGDKISPVLLYNKKEEINERAFIIGDKIRESVKRMLLDVDPLEKKYYRFIRLLPTPFYSGFVNKGKKKNSPELLEFIYSSSDINKLEMDFKQELVKNIDFNTPGITLNLLKDVEVLADIKGSVVDMKSKTKKFELTQWVCYCVGYWSYA